MAHLSGDPFFGTRPLEPHNQPNSGGLLKNSLKPKADKKTDYNTLDGNDHEDGKSYGSTFGTKSACLFFLPTLAGIAVLCLFILSFWKHGDLCWGVFGACVFCGLVMCCVGWKGGLPAHNDAAISGYSPMFMNILGGCVIFTSLLGLMLGAIGYFSYMRSYQIFSGSTRYEHVSPNANPDAYQDAGAISFTADAYIDFYKAAAYRKGETYCAAPILGGLDPSFISFWAVGIDCCGKGYFRCGAAVSDSRASAIGGLVVLDENPRLSQSIPMYMRAAEESAVRAGFAMSPKPIFIEWSASIDTAVRTFREDCTMYVAIASLGIASMMFFVVLCCVSTQNSKTRNGGVLDRMVDKFYSNRNAGEFVDHKFNVQQDNRNTRFRGHGETLSRNPFN